MKKSYLFIIGLITGMLAGVLLTLLFVSHNSRHKTEDTETVISSDSTVLSDETSKEAAAELTKEDVDGLEELSDENSSEKVKNCDSPQWDSATVYNGGDRVVYQNRIYRAKWWTQGETPGEADVWEDTLESPAASVESENSVPPIQITGKNFTVPEDFKIVGYYPSWKPGETGKIRYDVLTHIIYALGIPTAEGTLRPLDNPDTAHAIIQTAHASDCKVLLAIGGGSYNDVPLEATFMAATETEEKRAALVKAILEVCDEYGFDGIDMDWEHPRVDGSSSKQYEALMVALADELHQRGKILTSAVLSGATADGNIYYDAAAHTNKVLEAVDWIHVMAYDGGDGERHSAYDFAVNSGKYWHETRGLPSQKVVLGVPFYARPSWESYEHILADNADAWKKDMVQYNGMEVWYNGVDTIQKKTQYALDNLGGIMIWEVTQDTADKGKSLQSAIAEVVSGQN